MSNPLYFLFALLLASAYPTGAEPLSFARTPALSLAAWGGILLAIAIGAVLSYRGTPAHRRLALTRTGFKTLSLFAFAALLFVFHYPLLVWEGIRLEDVPVLDDVATLLPFFSMLGIHALFSSRAESRLRADGSSTAGILSFGWRTFLGFSLFPVLLMISLRALFFHVTWIVKWTTLYPFLAWILALTVILLFFSLAPLYLAVVFRARPLPSGPKRDRLVALADRARFRYRRLLLIRTGGSRIANAFIVGIGPHLRTVFFTDLLYEGLDEEELECVMAHEMTHALRRHLSYYFSFGIAFVAFAAVLQQWLWQRGAALVVLSLVSVGLFFLLWVILFGFVSRRFETEADLVGMRLFSAPEEVLRSRRFARALYHVARLNRMAPDVGSWRHFSVARRALILLSVDTHPEIGRRLESFCSRVRKAGLTALGLVGLLATWQVKGDLADLPRARREWSRVEQAARGWRLLREGRPAEAAPLLEESTRHPDARGELHLALAEAYEKLGEREKAANSRLQAGKVGLTDPRFRLLLGEYTAHGQKLRFGDFQPPKRQNAKGSIE